MENFKTNLTVTITGASVDEEGLLRVVDARYENVRALYMGALRIAEDGELKIAEAVVGQFPGTMWADLMLRMLDCAKLHGNDALVPFKWPSRSFWTGWRANKAPPGVRPAAEREVIASWKDMSPALNLMIPQKAVKIKAAW